MNKEEISNWFQDKLNSCYVIQNSDYKKHLFLTYDKQYIRKLKLGKLNNQKITLPNKPKGICMFTQNLKHNMMYFNYDIIAEIFNNNNIVNYDNIQLIISDVLSKCDFPKLNDNNVKYKYYFERFQKIIYDSRDVRIYDDKMIL